MAGLVKEVGSNRATMQQKLRSALAHKAAADAFLSALTLSQTKLNAVLAKINADAPGSLDVNYHSTLVIAPLFDPDMSVAGQHKASLRATMRSALAHRKLADELVESIEEFEYGFNALLTKLDAQAGVLASTNFLATLSLIVVDEDGAGTGAQHKASLRKSLRSALANAHLADQILDAVHGLQHSFNAALVKLDAGTITGVMAPLYVTVLDPMSRS